MASFSPDLPSPQAYSPDWTNSVGKPITDLIPDRSKGIALSTAGESLSGATKVAESQFENYVGEKVRAGVETVRDQTTAAYESIRRAQLQGVPPDPRAVGVAGFTGTLNSNSEQSVPDGVQAGLDKATQLQLAKQQGKANDTLYTGALNSLAKELRAQYPGHRDFIDEQISKISGINPANAYMQNLLTDINRAGTGQDWFTKHIEKLANDYSGDIGVQTAILAAKAGKPGAQERLISEVYRAAAEDNRYKKQQAEHNARKAAGEDISDDMKFRADQHFNDILHKHLDNIFATAGLTGVKNISDLVTLQNQGKLHISPQQWEGLASLVDNAQRMASEEMRDVGQRNYQGLIKSDPTYLDTLRQSKLGYYSDLSKSIRDQQTGTAFELKRRNDEQQEETRGRIYASSIGEFTRAHGIMSKELGQVWANFIDSQTITAGNRLKDLQSFFGDQLTNMSIPPDLRQSQNHQSLETSLKAAKTAKSEGVNSPVPYDNLVQNVDMLLKAKEMGNPPVAKNIVDYMFDPQKNGKIMDFFGIDYTDSNGQFHKGRFSVYDTLTKQPITDAVWDLHDKASWQKYKDWQEFSFNSLFGKEVKDLSQYTAAGSPFKLSWDSENHRFGIQWEKKDISAAGMSAQADIMRNATRSINAINGALSNLSYMHGKEGGDTNQYLWDIMQLQPQDEGTIGGQLPKKVMDAVRAAHTPPPSVGEAMESALKAEGKKRKEAQ